MDLKIILKSYLQHIPVGFSMSTISSFRTIENKYDVYRGKHCMKLFCDSLREHIMKITNSKKKNMKLLTKSSKNHTKICYACKKNWK